MPTKAEKKEKKQTKELKLFLKRSGLKSNSEKVGEVMRTYQYDMFSLLDMNRDIDESNVKNIMESIDMFGYQPVPIIINEYGEVIDGQNRLEALRRTGNPVYYYMIPGLNITHVPLFQTGRPWKVKDWLKLHVKQGNKHYMVYKEFKDKYKLGHLHVVNLLYGYELPDKLNQDKLWRRGLFETKYLAKATKFMDKVELMKPYLDDNLFYEKKRTNGLKRDLIYALELVMDISQFDYNRFLKNIQLADAPSILCWGEKAGFIQNILDVHNYDLPDNIKVKMA
jgi:hypothetical protein